MWKLKKGMTEEDQETRDDREAIEGGRRFSGEQLGMIVGRHDVLQPGELRRRRDRLGLSTEEPSGVVDLEEEVLNVDTREEPVQAVVVGGVEVDRGSTKDEVVAELDGAETGVRMVFFPGGLSIEALGGGVGVRQIQATDQGWQRSGEQWEVGGEGGELPTRRDVHYSAGQRGVGVEISLKGAMVQVRKEGLLYKVLKSVGME